MVKFVVEFFEVVDIIDVGVAVGLVFLVVVVTQIVEETVGLIIFWSAVGGDSNC